MRIAVDGKGNAYITGTATSPDLPIKNAFQDKPKGPQNAFVTKFDGAGNVLVYSTYLGGSGAIRLTASLSIPLATRLSQAPLRPADFPIKNAFQKTLKSRAMGTRLSRKSLPLETRSYIPPIWAVQRRSPRRWWQRHRYRRSRQRLYHRLY